MGYIEGEDRKQTVLFPEVLDDYISEENPVRFIDVFIEGPAIGRASREGRATKVSRGASFWYHQTGNEPGLLSDAGIKQGRSRGESDNTGIQPQASDEYSRSKENDGGRYLRRRDPQLRSRGF